MAGKAVERIAEHADKHGLASVDVILHGGEPLLAGAEWLAEPGRLAPCPACPPR